MYGATPYQIATKATISRIATGTPQPEPSYVVSEICRQVRFSHNFLSSVHELVIFDLQIGFLVKNCISRQLGVSRIQKHGEHMIKYNPPPKKLGV